MRTRRKAAATTAAAAATSPWLLAACLGASLIGMDYDDFFFPFLDLTLNSLDFYGQIVIVASHMEKAL